MSDRERGQFLCSRLWPCGGSKEVGGRHKRISMRTYQRHLQMAMDDDLRRSRGCLACPISEYSSEEASVARKLNVREQEAKRRYLGPEKSAKISGLAEEEETEGEEEMEVACWGAEGCFAGMEDMEEFGRSDNDSLDEVSILDEWDCETGESEAICWMAWKQKYGVSEAALKAALKLSKCKLSLYDVKEVLSQSGVHLEKVDCCVESHIAFTGKYSELSKCPYPGCGEKRYKGVLEKEGRKMFEYIPIRSRLAAWCRSKHFLDLMRYRHAETLKLRASTYEPPISAPLLDYVYGRHYQISDAKAEFEELDVCLALSIDGKNLFNCNDYNIWPVVLLNLNLPPSLRSRVENMIPFGMIPGPKNPKDIETFLLPLYEELKELEQGVVMKVWNGERRKVRAFLLFVTADLPAMSKITLTKGHNSKFPCRFCEMKGIYCDVAKGYYYPSRVRERSERFSSTRVFWDPECLNVKERTRFKVERDWKLLNSAESKKEREILMRECGLSGKPIIFGFSSLLEPFQSFPIDTMHLLYGNIAQYMWLLWSGENKTSNAISYVLDTNQIGKDLEGNGMNIPVSFGRRPRNIAIFYKRFKAEEWKNFVVNYSLPLLEGRMGMRYLAGWKLFVDLCKLLAFPSPDKSYCRLVYEAAAEFYKHYERDYYGFERENVKLMKLVFHLLLHLGDNLENCGPLCNLDQFKIERYIGNLDKKLHSRVKAAENISQNILYDEAVKVMEMRRRRTPYELTANASYTPGSFEPSHVPTPSERRELCGFIQRHFTRNISFEDHVSEINVYHKVKITEGDLETTVRSWQGLQRLEGNVRRNCYVVAYFEEDEGEKGYYGRVEKFYLFRLKGCGEQEAVVIRWAEKLRRSRIGAIYANYGSVFGRKTVEYLNCLRTDSSIGLICRDDKKRVYFVDPRGGILRDTIGGFAS